jgi:hypothetical protein
MSAHRTVKIMLGLIWVALSGYDSETRVRAERAILTSVDDFYCQLECQEPGTSCAALSSVDGFVIAIEAWHDMCVIHRITTCSGTPDIADFRFARDGIGRLPMSKAVRPTGPLSRLPVEGAAADTTILGVATRYKCGLRKTGTKEATTTTQDMADARRIILATDYLHTTVSDDRPVAIGIAPVRRLLSAFPVMLFADALAAIFAACDNVFDRCDCLAPGAGCSGVEAQGDFTIHYEASPSVFRVVAIHRSFPTSCGSARRLGR